MPKEMEDSDSEKQKKQLSSEGITEELDPLIKLKQKVQSVVDTMDPDSQHTENNDSDPLRDLGNGIISKTEGQEPEHDSKQPRAIDMFLKTEPAINKLIDKDKIEYDGFKTSYIQKEAHGSDAEDLSDLIREEIQKNGRIQKRLPRKRVGRRGWHFGKHSQKPSENSSKNKSPLIKASDRHLKYLEKLKAKKAQEKLDQENAINKANERKEKLKKKVLDRCKLIKRTRNVESVNNTQSDFNKSDRLNKTSNSSRSKQFMIRRLKSSNEYPRPGGNPTQRTQTPKIQNNGQRKSQQGNRRTLKLAPLNTKPPLAPANQGRVSGIERRSKKRAASLAPTLGLKSKRFPSGSDSGYGDQGKSAQGRSLSTVKKNKKPKLKSYSFISSVGEWLKKNRLPPKTKVFIISNGYQCIKKALKDRGWVQNPSYFSTCFHLKFTLKGSHVGFEGLTNNQIVNHFEKVSVLTTKVGLTKTMNQLHLFANVDQDSFFPKSFDCNEEMEFEAFCMYFKQLEAECILKKYLELAMKQERETEIYQMYDKNDSIQIRTALKVCRRRMMHLGELIDSKKDWVEVTEKEWDILSRGAKTQEDIKQMMFDKNIKRYEKMAKKVANGKKKKRRKKKRRKTKKATEKSSKGSINAPTDHKEEDSTNSESLDDEDFEEEEELNLTPLEQECRYILSKLEKKYPQTKMNGKQNIWVVKPAGLSRGRGIELFSSFHEIYHHLKTRDFSWVIQKYIENPMCYRNKKMDIRQWVLVTDWNPLTVWFYQECYVRLSTNDFDLKNIKNRFTHLTNNSVNKRSDNFVVEDGFATQADFAESLNEEYGDGSWKKVVRQMKKQVKWSLQCAQASVVNRKNSGEIFGYDFCIDQDLNVWLIEINASPDFGFTSTVTEDLVRRASEDYIKVVVDWNKASKKKKKTINTGLFKRTYKSRKHEKCKEALGLKFECVGKKVNLDKYKKFFKKEDKQFNSNYEQWLGESHQYFDYDSDQEQDLLEDKGTEYSKMTTQISGFGLENIPEGKELVEEAVSQIAKKPGKSQTPQDLEEPENQPSFKKKNEPQRPPSNSKKEESSPKNSIVIKEGKEECESGNESDSNSF